MTKLFPWQRSYRDALLELNPVELRVKINRAVSELQNRSRELMFAQDVQSLIERQAVMDALNGLDSIERYELTAPFEALIPSRPATA